MDSATDEALFRGESAPLSVQRLVAVHVLLLVGAVWFAWSYPALEFSMVLVSGVGFAQAALIAIWLVLGRGPSAKRVIAISLFLGLLVLLPQIVCPIAILSFPLIMSQSDGLHLRRFTPESMPPARPLQFSMWQLIRLTLVMAILFSLAQFGPRDRRELVNANLGEIGAVLSVIGVVVVGITCGVIGLTIPIVCVWAVLLPGRVLPRLAISVVGWALGVALMFHFAGGVYNGLVLAVVIAAFSTVLLILSLVAMRWMGYRAIWLVERSGVVPGA